MTSFNTTTSLILKLFNLPENIVKLIIDMIYVRVLVKMPIDCNTYHRIIRGFCRSINDARRFMKIATNYVYYDVDVGKTLLDNSHYTKSTFVILNYWKSYIRKWLIRNRPFIYITNSETHLIDEKDLPTLYEFKGVKLRSSVKKPLQHAKPDQINNMIDCSNIAITDKNDTISQMELMQRPQKTKLSKHEYFLFKCRTKEAKYETQILDKLNVFKKNKKLRKSFIKNSRDNNIDSVSVDSQYLRSHGVRYCSITEVVEGGYMDCIMYQGMQYYPEWWIYYPDCYEDDFDWYKHYTYVEN